MAGLDDLGLLDELEPEFSQSTTVQRLRAHERRLGRPLRVLHIGNIANNGYNNAKMLDAAGVDSDVIAYDYYHIMGCPEWEDADIVGTIDDDMAPDWSAVDLGGYQRPAWFAQGPRAVCTRYLRSRWSSSNGAATETARDALDAALRGHVDAQRHRVAVSDVWHKRHRIPSALAYRAELAGARLAQADVEARIIHSRTRLRQALAPPSAEVARTLPRWHPRRVQNAAAWRLRQRSFYPSNEASSQLGDRLERYFDAGVTKPVKVGVNRLGRSMNRRAAQLEWAPDTATRPTTKAVDPFDERIAELQREFRRRFPLRDDQLQADDFVGYRSVVDDWAKTFEHYDLIEAYSTDPILPMLVGTKPYVAYEHGTIRDIPFEDSPRGRLTALAYAMADAVIITNPDCRSAAERLGVRSATFIPHLIDRKYYDTAAHEARALPAGVASPYVFCPARQHWDVKGNQIGLEAFARVAPDHPDLRLVISSWGPDVERSQQLLQRLGVDADRIIMIEPLRIRDLIAVTARAEVLIDQFHFAVFGGIGPTALACGTPLVTNLDLTLSDWCMQEPPYFHANDVDSCETALRSALAVDRSRHRVLQHDWMRTNYWYGDVPAKHLDVYLDVLDAEQPQSIESCDGDAR